MATETIQAPAPAMPTVPGRTTAAGNGRAGLPPPRRGQIKGKILKDVVAAVSAIAGGLVNKNTRGGAGAGGVPASDDTDEK